MRASFDSAKQYEKMQQQSAPPTPVLINVIKAFVVGGIICTIGQFFLGVFVNMGLTPTEASVPLAGTMVFLGALFTGLGWYDELGEFAGMGAALPITGFANAIVSPAMEFKREGLVQGVGRHMFEVAGPVFVYGLSTSFVIGAVRYFLGAY